MPNSCELVLVSTTGCDLVWHPMEWNGMESETRFRNGIFRHGMEYKNICCALLFFSLFNKKTKIAIQLLVSSVLALLSQDLTPGRSNREVSGKWSGCVIVGCSGTWILRSPAWAQEDCVEIASVLPSKDLGPNPDQAVRHPPQCYVQTSVRFVRQTHHTLASSYFSRKSS